MTIIEIIPLNSAGQINLGLSRNEVTDLIGKPSKSLNNTDYYDLNSVFFTVFYDQSEKAEYIEYSKPTNVMCKVLFQGLDIFETSADDIIKQIKNLTGLEISEKSEIPFSYIFSELELSFWRPVLPEDEHDEDGKYFSTIGIGNKGYYSENE